MNNQAVVWSGGGAYFAFEVGVNRVLADRGIDHQHQFGVSAGGLISVINAQHPIGLAKAAADEADAILKSVKGNKSIYKRWWFLGQLEGLLWRRSLVNSKPLWDLIQKHCDEEKIRNSGKTLRLGCTSYGKGMYHEATENTPDLWKWVAATSAFAPYFLPIEIDGDYWVDGGYRCIAPLKSAIDAGCTNIDVVITSTLETYPEDVSKCKTALDVAMRLVGMMTDEIILRDVQKALKYNDLIMSGHPLGEGKKRLNIRLFRPSHKLHGGSRNFDQKLLAEHRTHGIEVAQQVLDKKE